MTSTTTTTVNLEICDLLDITFWNAFGDRSECHSSPLFWRKSYHKINYGIEPHAQNYKQKMKNITKKYLPQLHKCSVAFGDQKRKSSIKIPFWSLANVPRQSGYPNPSYHVRSFVRGHDLQKSMVPIQKRQKQINPIKQSTLNRMFNNVGDEIVIKIYTLKCY